MMLQNESVDDEIEHFEDIVEASDDELEKPTAEATQKNGQNDHDSKVENGKIQVPGKGDKDVLSSEVGTTLPAGYNPRHREPSYCNADRAAWWELSVLASHVHPSVATMARTLLSGAPIVYNGNPLCDLSLSAFLDKFMEKKPKSNKIAEGKWHGGSNIAPNRKIDMNPRLIGEDILQLAEDEVPPEDLFFHQYYMSKSGSRNRKTKKAALDDDEDETGGDLLLDGDAPVDSEEDEEEDAEIDEMMGGGSIMSDQDEYDYDDLDRIGGDDEDELLGNAADAETRSKQHDSDVEDIDVDSDAGNDDEDCFGSDVDEVEVDNEDDGSTKLSGQGRKRKHGGGVGGTPFASLEDFEHLMKDEEAEKVKGKKLKGKEKTKNKNKDEKNDRSKKRKKSN